MKYLHIFTYITLTYSFCFSSESHISYTHNTTTRKTEKLKLITNEFDGDEDDFVTLEFHHHSSAEVAEKLYEAERQQYLKKCANILCHSATSFSGLYYNKINTQYYGDNILKNLKIIYHTKDDLKNIVKYSKILFRYMTRIYKLSSEKILHLETAQNSFGHPKIVEIIGQVLINDREDFVNQTIRLWSRLRKNFNQGLFWNIPENKDMHNSVSYIFMKDGKLINTSPGKDAAATYYPRLNSYKVRLANSLSLIEPSRREDFIQNALGAWKDIPYFEWRVTYFENSIASLEG